MAEKNLPHHLPHHFVTELYATQMNIVECVIQVNLVVMRSTGLILECCKSYMTINMAEDLSAKTSCKSISNKQ